MNNFDVNGKIALVIGANRGIGRAFVESLVARGASKVYACTRNEQHFEELLAIDNKVIEPILLDVTNAQHIKALPEKVPALDLLVNNAGIVNACFPTAQNAADIARQEMETNYFGPLNITLALLPVLKQAKGAIVNISSIAGISNFPSLGPYSATKAALHSFTQGLRAELSAGGILVTGVYPGPIDTRMTEDFEMDKAPTSQVADRTLDGIAQGRVEIFPDNFSEQMYATFLNSPADLEKAFSEMH